ncbi:MAG: hypothetical protein M3N98_08745, partial [Actinomycetota bacterium]|nr:hypothetical protein [Actinomycetota bacterium]
MAACHVVIEDAPHHHGLGLVDLVVGRDGAAAGHAPVTVGDLGEDGFAGAHLEQLPPPLPFSHLGLLVLGDDALHLDQQPCLRVVIDGRRVGESDIDTEACQLVEDQHLVREVPGQAVGGQHPHPFEHAGLGLVAQCVEPGAVQA